MRESFQKVVSGSIAGVASRVTEAIVKFATLPLLISHFGKFDYGLIELVIATNAYVQLLDMGLNVGAVKHFSQWFGEGRYRSIIRVSQSNIVFYSAIGSLNVVVLLLMGSHASSIFNLQAQQVETVKQLFCITAISAFLNWMMHTVNQLLLASENIAWAHFMGFVRSLTGFISAWMAGYYGLSLVGYFWLFTILGIVYIPLSLFKVHGINRKIRVWWYLLPSWHWKYFQPVFRYGLAVAVLGILQFSANYLRPVILGMVSPDMGILSEYRVLQNIGSLLSIFGSIFIMSMLPVSSKSLHRESAPIRQTLLVQGTRYVTFFLSFILVVVAVLRSEFLLFYVGSEFQDLAGLVLVMCLTTLLQIHLSPVVSMVYAIGKLRALVLYTSFSAVLSLTALALFGAAHGVAAAIVSFAFYIVLQSFFYYLYYIPRLVKVDARQVLLQGFLPGLVAWILTFVIATMCLQVAPISGTIETMIARIVCIAVTFPLIVWLLLTNEERQVVHRYVGDRF